MADNQKYYYLRLKDGFFEEDKLIVLESMPDGYLYSNILLKLYLKSLKSNGKLMFNDRIPYNSQILATLTRQPVGVVEKAIHIFKELGIIEVLDNGAIFMLDIQDYIGKSTTEADRKREYRNRISEEKRQMSGQISDKTTPEIEIELERELELEKEKELDTEKEKRERVNYQQVADMYNNTCVSFPQVKALSETRKKSIKARLKNYSLADIQKVFEKAEKSNFLKGSNSRNWSATFDWILKDNNMAKVLEGNYDNKAVVENMDRYKEVENWV